MIFLCKLTNNTFAPVSWLDSDFCAELPAFDLLIPHSLVSAVLIYCHRLVFLTSLAACLARARAVVAAQSCVIPQSCFTSRFQLCLSAYLMFGICHKYICTIARSTVHLFRLLNMHMHVFADTQTRVHSSNQIHTLHFHRGWMRSCSVCALAQVAR